MPALGAEGRHLQGRKLVWGGKEYGALRLGTPRHSILHFDPQATTFLSPPGGIYLILSPENHSDFVFFYIIVFFLKRTESSWTVVITD